jgi:hypothetical protein
MDQFQASNTTLSERRSTGKSDAKAFSSSGRGTSSGRVSNNSNGLTVLSTAALFVADVVGTGILALPYNVRVVLGSGWGILFLLMNLPINIYAAYMLHETATGVEKDDVVDDEHSDCEGDCISEIDAITREEETLESIDRNHYQIKPLFIDTYSSDAADLPNESQTNHTYEKLDQLVREDDELIISQLEPQQKRVSTVFTDDFIGISGAVFGEHSQFRLLVLYVYYANLVLVLGNYVLVMSHSVQAVVGKDRICIPSSGLIASTLMFTFSQFDSMAMLGKVATSISLVALVIVVVQCLFASTSTSYSMMEEADFFNHHNDSDPSENDQYTITSNTPPSSIMTTLSSLSSITFAVGSQKLFLNIRHDMVWRDQSVLSLGIALFTFVTAYIAVSVLAGPTPPKFLLDAIPNDTLAQRLAGLFLWIHVAVSYAINSQALCSSMDRLLLIGTLGVIHIPPRRRWILLTLGTCATSFIIANAIPFFQDLTSLIGALTSTPLSLFLPAVLYRKFCNVSICYPTLSSLGSYALMMLSSVFIVCGLIAALSSIEVDWANQKDPFSCS